MYDYEINHLPSSLRWWKCTSFQLLLYVIFMETETYWVGWFVANKRVLPCFLRASCLLWSFLGFSGGHGRERKQVSSSVGTVCTCHATRKMKFICCCWPLERTSLCRLEWCAVGDRRWTKLYICFWTQELTACLWFMHSQLKALTQGHHLVHITFKKKKKQHLTHRLSHLPCNGKSQHNTFTRYWKPRNGPRC